MLEYPYKEVVNMSYRIIEDQKGLHQAILNETEEAKEVIHNINNIFSPSSISEVNT